MQKGINFIDGKKQVVSQPTARSSVAVYEVVKEVESVKSAVVEVMPGVPLNPAKMSVIRDRQDYYDVKKEEVLVKTRELSVIFPPTRGYEVAEWGVKVYSVKAWMKGRRRKDKQRKYLEMLRNPHLSTSPLPVYWIAWNAEAPIQSSLFVT